MDSRIVRRLLLFYLSGTRGGYARLQILAMLMNKPLNINEIAKRLDIDYKTAEYHVRVLKKSGFLSSPGKAYADAYSLSPLLKAHKNVLEGVFADLGKSR